MFLCYDLGTQGGASWSLYDVSSVAAPWIAWHLRHTFSDLRLLHFRLPASSRRTMQQATLSEFDDDARGFLRHVTVLTAYVIGRPHRVEVLYWDGRLRRRSKTSSLDFPSVYLAHHRLVRKNTPAQARIHWLPYLPGAVVYCQG